MKLLENQTYYFPNFGIPHENNLNLIGLILTSRKVRHNVPVSVNIDPETFAKACSNGNTDLLVHIQDLWATCDALGLRFQVVEGIVDAFPRTYKITFKCYGN